MNVNWGELLDRSRSEIYIFDAESLRFVHVNHGAVENLGYSLEELRQMTPLDIKPLLDAEAFEKILEPLRSGGSRRHNFGTVHERKDGTTYPVDVHLHVESWDDRPVFLAIILDVTERERAQTRAQELEAQLRQAQRLEAIGRLAGGVAHDFNNLLTVIMTSTELLKAQSVPSQGEELAAIADASRRAAALTAQLLAFGRRQTLVRRAVGLNSVIGGLRPMIERLMPENIRVHFSLAERLAPIFVDQGKLEQVVINLVANARDAMPKGGELTIATFHAESASNGEGRFVGMLVSDTGEGMDPTTRAHIFEPFFTTKSEVGGSGLGLATVHGIVKQSGGSIDVESTAGVGSTFRILLPCAESREVAAPDEAEGEAEAPSAGTILLVEDDDMVRRMACLGLESANYTVLQAAGGKQALEVSRGFKGTVDLLLSDVVMRAMDGPTLAKAIRAERPGIRVLFVSGYADGVIAGDELLSRGENFLQKPFTPKTLCAKVEAILSRVDDVAPHESAAERED